MARVPVASSKVMIRLTGGAGKEKYGQRRIRWRWVLGRIWSGG
jgi:hypothetical protein